MRKLRHGVGGCGVTIGNWCFCLLCIPYCGKLFFPHIPRDLGEAKTQYPISLQYGACKQNSVFLDIVTGPRCANSNPSWVHQNPPLGFSYITYTEVGKERSFSSRLSKLANVTCPHPLLIRKIFDNGTEWAREKHSGERKNPKTTP